MGIKLIHAGAKADTISFRGIAKTDRQVRRFPSQGKSEESKTARFEVSPTFST